MKSRNRYVWLLFFLFWVIISVKNGKAGSISASFSQLDAVLSLNSPPVATNDTVTLFQIINISVLSNDTDIDGNIDSSSLTILEPPMNGTINQNPDGTLTYTSAWNYTGVDSAIYIICDDSMACDTAKILIVVLGPQGPVAKNDSAYSVMDSSVLIAIFDNDYDLDGTIDSSTIIIVSMPSNGSMVYNPIMGKVAFTPNSFFVGLDSFKYMIYDNDSYLSNVATVYIYIQAVNVAPVAVNDSVFTPEDVSVLIVVWANDYDPDGTIDVTSVGITAPPQNGTVSVNPANGYVLYSPNVNFNGIDSFAYTIQDNYGLVSVAVVYINISSTTPIALNDIAFTLEDTPVLVDVLNNDFDPDGNLDSTNVSLVSSTVNGTVVINGMNGVVLYTPDANFSGVDSFQYVVYDMMGQMSGTAIVRIYITSQNDAPISQNEVVSTLELTAINIDVLSNDIDIDGVIDTSSLSVLQPPSNGVLVINFVSGIITYTPDFGFVGVDSFTYQVADDSLETSNPGIVVINVSNVDLPPIGVSDTVSLQEDFSVIIEVLLNDSDPDGFLDSTSVAAVSLPTNGNLTINPATGVIVYVPNTNYYGDDSFSYTVSDDDGFVSNIVTVSLIIQPVNDPPVAIADYLVVLEDATTDLVVLNNDYDVESVSLIGSIIVVVPPMNGLFFVNSSTGVITYESFPDFHGNDTLWYVVFDEDSLYSDTTLVSIQILSQDDPPLALNDTVLAYQEDTTEFSMYINDSDIDGDIDFSSTVFLSTPDHGIFSYDMTLGLCSFIPDPGFNGTTSFFYQLMDSSGLTSNTAEVIIQILPASQVVGLIFNDSNGNCLLDGNEEPLYGWNQLVEGSFSSFSTSDSNGFFMNSVGLGAYSLTSVPPLPQEYWPYWSPSLCASLPITGQANSVGQIDTVYIPMQQVIDCPILAVEISTPWLRNCWNNVYTVQYENLGNLDVPNATVSVELHPELTVTNSGIPFQVPQVGDLYVFDIGAIPAGQSGSFTITTYLSCELEVWQTVCVEAKIEPDSICLPPDPSWDGASVGLELECIGDSSVGVGVSNNGSGGMLTPGTVIVIIEDNILRLDTNFQLATGGSFSFELPADGSSYFVKATQSPGHPGSNYPMKTLEGCGVNDQGGISVGFVQSYPQNEENSFIDIECEYIMAPWDPNDKTAYPGGVTEDHFIQQGQEMEYRIRFQNTGNDTAFNVFILDTLSQYLNPLTVVPGLSSHDYELTISQEGILRFDFFNIMLVDSFANEPESHGFVKFKVRQKPNLSIGSIIENVAAIYFDFNEAVITNTTFNTIGQDFWSLVMLDNSLNEKQPMTVYPNPFTQEVTFDVGTVYDETLWLDIRDLQGRLVSSKSFRNAENLVFRPNNLTKGVYIFNLHTNSKTIGSGKIELK